MSEIISKVLGSRRLKRFSATYAMMYVVMSLILNYISTLSIFDGALMSYVFVLISMTVQAPFMFGCIRGIVTRDYNVGKGLGCFGEVDKYPFYLAYIVLNVGYEIIYGLVFSLTDNEGALQFVGLALSIVFLLVRILLNVLIIKIYFDAIFAEREKPRFSISASFNGFLSVISEKPGKIIAAEFLMWLFGFFSLQLGSSLAGLLPQHSIVPLLLSCFVAVQFGMITLTWPVYYLYYKETCDIKENEKACLD